MKIISHRGYWKADCEKNTQKAFERSFSLGYGTETDIRDFGGTLVISHDMPHGSNILFSEFLNIASQFASSNSLTLALNIKADGLANSVASLVKAYPNLDCFVFDMSVPDMRSYFIAKVPVFTRMSEVEQSPSWIEQSVGVWLDAFSHEWYTYVDIKRILSLKKRVCIVSPELHGRLHQKLWEMLLPLSEESDLILCTDIPDAARSFFGSMGK